jgi:antitoxin PrlF
MAKFTSVSKLTSKSQTTIPLPVRKALGLTAGDRISFTVLPGGRVEITKEVSLAADDNVVAAYLEFLERDMVKNPAKLAVLERDPAIDQLLAGVDVSELIEEATSE